MSEDPGRIRKSNRLDAALRLRDSALSKLRSEGSFVDTNIGPYLTWTGQDLMMGLRTPFQKLPPVTEEIKYFAAKTGKGPANLSYGLDIWVKKRKVLNIEWNDTGEIRLVSFRRGDWEQGVLNLD